MAPKRQRPTILCHEVRTLHGYDRVALPLPPGPFARHCGRLFKGFPIHVSNQDAIKRLAGVQLGHAKLAILTVAQAVGLSVGTVSNLFAGSTTVNSEVRDWLQTQRSALSHPHRKYGHQP